VKSNFRFRPIVVTSGALCLLLIGSVASFHVSSPQAQASSWWHIKRHACSSCDDGPPMDELGGTWYWLRSPEDEKRVVASLYNRYCIRCHGVDGRGIWDIPDVPNFASGQWQASRTDGQLVRATLQGRGAVMPPFRGTLSLEEAWAMARYLRTFVPGTDAPKEP